MSMPRYVPTACNVLHMVGYLFFSCGTESGTETKCISLVRGRPKTDSDWLSTPKAPHNLHSLVSISAFLHFSGANSETSLVHKPVWNLI